MADGLGGQVGRALGRALVAGAQAALRTLGQRSRSAAPAERPAASSRRPPASSRSAPAGAAAGRGYPGDFTGTPRIEYRPDPDGDADPGEVVWGWVPYEEDHGRGKDRPVLVIGRDGAWLLGLMMSSQDHDRDAADEARFGRYWFDVGTGAWDPQRRPSEVRLDRIVRLDPAAVRREGAALDRAVFEAVAVEVHAVPGRTER